MLLSGTKALVSRRHGKHFCPSCLSPDLPLTGWETQALWEPEGAWEADGSNLKETKISASHRSMRSDLLLIGHESTFAPGKEKIWTTHCSFRGDRLPGGWMEHRLGTGEPAARRKPLAWRQGSRLPGTCDATGVWLQNDFPTLHTRGSESSRVT